jgi:hypothetical protein
MRKNKVIRWCVRIEPSELWEDFDEWSRKYPEDGSNDYTNGVWYGFVFDSAKERREFLKAHKEHYGSEMGKFGQICLYREVEG